MNRGLKDEIHLLLLNILYVSCCESIVEILYIALSFLQTNELIKNACLTLRGITSRDFSLNEMIFFSERYPIKKILCQYKFAVTNLTHNFYFNLPTCFSILKFTLL